MNLTKTVSLDIDTFLDNHFETFLQKAQNLGFTADQLVLLENGEITEISDELGECLENVEVEFQFEPSSKPTCLEDPGEPSEVNIERITARLGEKELDLSGLDVYDEVEEELTELGEELS